MPLLQKNQRATQVLAPTTPPTPPEKTAVEITTREAVVILSYAADATVKSVVYTARFPDQTVRTLPAADFWLACELIAAPVLYEPQVPRHIGAL